MGQLNYLYWAIRKGIVQYLWRHLEKVKKDMNEYQPSPEPVRKSRVVTPVMSESIAYSEEELPHFDLTTGSSSERERHKKRKRLGKMTNRVVNDVDLFS